MSASISVNQDIFELVLDFYRAPSSYPELLDPLAPLPESISDLLELTAGEVAARSKILSRAAASESPSELIDATSYFTEQVLFAPGGDHYRVLGLNHDATMDDIRLHYELLVNLFYQDKEDNSIQSNEADFSRLNRAYSVLRDEDKRKEYDKSLESQGRLSRPAKNQEVKEPELPEPTPAPLSNVQPIDPYLTPREKKNDTDEHHFETKSTPKNVKSKVKSSAARTKLGLPKILIVDDSATVRAGLSLTLNKEFECITAKDGEKGWNKLHEFDDIMMVLTDLDMPELNGYEFTKRIRDSDVERIKNIPVIVVTGTEDLEAKQKALTAGADDFLAKSTDYIEVLTRVKVHYKLVETQQQLAESQEKMISEHAAAPIYATDESERESGYVPLLSEQKSSFTPAMTFGAFGAVAIVLVTLLYLTQVTPDAEDSVALEQETGTQTELNNDTQLSQISRELDGKPVVEDNAPDSSALSGNGLGSDPNKNTAQKTRDSGAIERKVTEPTPKPTVSSSKPEMKKPVVVAKAKTPPATVSKKAEPVKKKTTEKPVNKSVTEKSKVTSAKSAPAVVPLVVKADKTVTTPIKKQPTAKNIKKDVKPAESMPVKKKTLVASTGVPLILPSQNNTPGRLPSATDAPSVNTLTTEAIEMDAAAGSTLALLESPKPDEEALVINQRDLSLFVFRFIRTYEDGNLFQFMRLFDLDAKTEDRSGRDGIREDYKDLFEKSAARRFTLGDLDWVYSGGSAKGTGFFEVQIWPEGSDKHKVFTGELTMAVHKGKSTGIQITELYHNF